MLCAMASGSQHSKGLCCLIFNRIGLLSLADGNNSLFICLNNSTNNTASHSRRPESSKNKKNTVLNRISTQYYKTVYDRKTQSYLHFTMCNGEQFIELYVKGTINGIKLRYSGKKTNPCFYK
jgi:hypothetical protein